MKIILGTKIVVKSFFVWDEYLCVATYAIHVLGVMAAKLEQILTYFTKKKVLFNKKINFTKFFRLFKYVLIILKIFFFVGTYLYLPLL